MDVCFCGLWCSFTQYYICVLRKTFHLYRVRVPHIVPIYIALINLDSGQRQTWTPVCARLHLAGYTCTRHIVCVYGIQVRCERILAETHPFLLVMLILGKTTKNNAQGIGNGGAGMSSTPESMPNWVWVITGPVQVCACVPGVLCLSLS